MPSSKTQNTWSVADILSATGGQLVCGDARQRFNTPAIDSRSLDPQACFVAICGVRHDGHGFVSDVVAGGCQSIIVQRDHLDQLPVAQWREGSVTCVAVDDTTRALGQLAGYHRRRMPAQVIAITGSNGKTTTKEFTRAIFEQADPVLATRGNLNNEIGLPLTLFGLQPQHRWAVVELGMNHAGEIARLGAICQPDVGIITNIGPAHLEGLGSIDGIREAKAELLATIGDGGHAILNRDDPQVCRLEGRAPREVWVGRTAEAMVRASRVKISGTETRFQLHLPDQAAFEARLRFINPVMVSNALAAAAAGWLAGIPASRIQAGLWQYAPQPGRMHVSTIGDGVNLIDDTYNANPVSMRAAMETLFGIGGSGRRVVVLGDMFELGEESLRLHIELGILAGGLRADRLYLAGEYAEAMAAGAKRGGLAPRQIFIGDHETIAQNLKETLQGGDWMLVKGSRGMAMEKILHHLNTLLGQRPDRN